ncbi:MAG: prephenate dehydrogenase [Kiritimatiellae bacterium]|nr:prephenate dehydrogenase [Kiritimatiellia bacterium]
MKKLSIIGLGLMGGSLGLAAKRCKIATEICGYARREETRTQATAMGAVDTVTDSVKVALKDADIVIFCLPVFTICDFIKKFSAEFSQNCIITDVGSTKGDIMNAIIPLLKDSPAEFIGSHPIAGSDQTGLDAATDDLYSNAMVIITPNNGETSATTQIEKFWHTLGSKTTIMNAEQHDQIMAATSHLPHIMAAILVDTVLASNNNDNITEFCGSGFRDTTRVAGGSEEIWHDIVKSNKAAITEQLNNFSTVLNKFQTLLENDDFEQLRTFFADNMERRKNI